MRESQTAYSEGSVETGSVKMDMGYVEEKKVYGKKKDS